MEHRPILSGLLLLHPLRLLEYDFSFGNCVLISVVNEVHELSKPEGLVFFAGEATSDEEMQV